MASRLGLIDTVDVVPMEDRLTLHHEQGRSRGFFRVPMGEWRGAARRMAHVGLFQMLPGVSAVPMENAGAFTARKSLGEDRLIGDWRPRNALGEQAIPPMFPFGPRLKSLMFRRGEGLHAQTRDLRHCFYLWGVGPGRLRKQAIGPRIPAAWLEGLHDEELDAPNHLKGSWWRADLLDGIRAAPPPCMDAVIMGSINAVSVVDHANRRMLLRGGALQLAEMPLDDLVILTIARSCLRSMLGKTSAEARGRAADTIWIELGLTAVSREGGERAGGGPCSGHRAQSFRGKSLIPEITAGYARAPRHHRLSPRDGFLLCLSPRGLRCPRARMPLRAVAPK